MTSELLSNNFELQKQHNCHIYVEPGGVLSPFIRRVSLQASFITSFNPHNSCLRHAPHPAYFTGNATTASPPPYTLFLFSLCLSGSKREAVGGALCRALLWEPASYQYHLILQHSARVVSIARGLKMPARVKLRTTTSSSLQRRWQRLAPAGTFYLHRPQQSKQHTTGRRAKSF